MKLNEVQQQDQSIWKPNALTGSINVYNKGLTSLQGAPRVVHGNFNCNRNQLVSLEGAPEYVRGNFLCCSNRLTSLHNIHRSVKEIGGHFYAWDNLWKSHLLGLCLINGLKVISLGDGYKPIEIILLKYLNGAGDILHCQEELIDAGYEPFARL